MMSGFRGAIALTAAALCTLAGVLVPRAQAAPSPGWRVVTLFSAKPYANLLTMTATGPSNAWAFGDSAGSGSPPVALHWNGKTWIASLPFGDVARPLWVSSTGWNNVWVAGEDCVSRPPYVARWNGRGWTITTFRNLPLCSGPMLTTGLANGWMFASSGAKTLASHFNGKTWRKVTIGNFGGVSRASAVSASDIWLVTETPTARMLVVHYDGRTWRSVPLPGIPAPAGEKPYPLDIDAVSSTNIWATAVVQRGNVIVRGPVRSLLLHWNGRTWQWIKVPYQDAAQEIAYDAGSVWVVAQTNVMTGDGWDFLRWSPVSHWTRVPAPTQGIPGTTVSYQLYSLVHIPRTHSFLASGDSAYAEGFSSKAAAVIFRYGP
jgi:hypothetical protein